jgi:hypothetical protein
VKATEPYDDERGMSAPSSLAKSYVGAEYQNYLDSQSRKETCRFSGAISKGDSAHAIIGVIQLKRHPERTLYD